MAHHNSTPRPVLEAPRQTVAWLVENDRRNRAYRRALRRRHRLRRTPRGSNVPYRHERREEGEADG